MESRRVLIRRTCLAARLVYYVGAILDKMNVRCTRLCPKDIYKSAVLPREESIKEKPCLNSERDFFISETACRIDKDRRRGFIMIAYSDTLLDLDSSFANTEFAEKHCNIVSSFI